MMDYIRRLRLCIRWFQEVEGGYLLEQENLRELLESAEKKCVAMGNNKLNSLLFTLNRILKLSNCLIAESKRISGILEVLMQNKEEELNAIIMELRKNYNLLQEKCAKEESDKLVSFKSGVYANSVYAYIRFVMDVI